MPPFSPAAKGVLPNSINEFCPEKPCHASLRTQGGSTRPVLLYTPVVLLVPAQSASAQYTEPGKCRLAGSGKSSCVLAIIWAMLEDPHAAFPGSPQDGDPSAGPPAS